LVFKTVLLVATESGTLGEGREGGGTAAGLLPALLPRIDD